MQKIIVMEEGGKVLIERKIKLKRMSCGRKKNANLMNTGIHESFIVTLLLSMFMCSYWQVRWQTRLSICYCLQFYRDEIIYLPNSQRVKRK